MSSPEKKHRTIPFRGRASKQAQRFKSQLTHSAPWSFQKRNDIFAFSLLASVLGPVSLFGWHEILEPRWLLDWACFFSLSYLSFQVFASSRLLLRLAAGWNLSLFVFSEYLSPHLSRAGFSWQQQAFSGVVVPLGIVLSTLIYKKTRPLWKSARVRTVIVGATPVGRELFERSQASTVSDLNIVGFFDYRKETSAYLPLGAALLDTPQALSDYIRTHQIDLVIITLHMQQQERIQELMNTLSQTTASVAFVPDIFRFDLMNSSLGEVSGIPVITLRDTPFYGIRRVLKRGMDFFLGLFLLIVLAPFFLLIAIGIKLSSPGPIFFRQKRVGLQTKPIEILKFRTMFREPVGTYPKPVQKNDRRVTRFGSWLRKRSLDELPQLLNVLQGSMSLVGPRPFPWEYSESYRTLVSDYSLRHKVKPGMTGWAQINGHRGMIQNVQQLKNRVEHDLFYVKHWSLLFDCQILLKSLPKVFAGDKTAF